MRESKLISSLPQKLFKPGEELRKSVLQHIFFGKYTSRKKFVFSKKYVLSTAMAKPENRKMKRTNRTLVPTRQVLDRLKLQTRTSALKITSVSPPELVLLAIT